MTDLIALRVRPVNLTNSLPLNRAPPTPLPPPTEQMKRSASRNLFGAPKRGEINALFEREHNRQCDYILKRFSFDIKTMKEQDRTMEAAVAHQRQQTQQEYNGNVGDNQQQHHHHQHQQQQKCNSLKINNNKQQQISSTTTTTTTLSPSHFGGKPYARQRTIKDYPFPVRKSLMQRRQETTPPNVPRCLAAAASANGVNKNQTMQISSETKHMSTPTIQSSLLSSTESSKSTLSNDSKTTENKEDKSNNNDVVNVVEVSETLQSTTEATTTLTAKCNETS